MSISSTGGALVIHVLPHLQDLIIKALVLFFMPFFFYSILYISHRRSNDAFLGMDGVPAAHGYEPPLPEPDLGPDRRDVVRSAHGEGHGG